MLADHVHDAKLSVSSADPMLIKSLCEAVNIERPNFKRN